VGRASASSQRPTQSLIKKAKRTHVPTSSVSSSALTPFKISVTTFATTTPWIVLSTNSTRRILTTTSLGSDECYGPPKGGGLLYFRTSKRARSSEHPWDDLSCDCIRTNCCNESNHCQATIQEFTELKVRHGDVTFYVWSHDYC
jgi:hypothetical protein